MFWQCATPTCFCHIAVSLKLWSHSKVFSALATHGRIACTYTHLWKPYSSVSTFQQYSAFNWWTFLLLRAGAGIAAACGQLKPAFLNTLSWRSVVREWSTPYLIVTCVLLMEQIGYLCSKSRSLLENKIHSEMKNRSTPGICWKTIFILTWF